MHSVDIKTSIRLPRLDRFLQERRRFTREHGIIIDTRATDEQQVGRNGGFSIMMRLADCGLYMNIKTPSVNTNTRLVTQHLLEEVHQSGP